MIPFRKTAVCVLAGLLGFAGCSSDNEPSSPAATFTIIQPADGASVDTFAFEIVVENTSAQVSPPEPRAILNGIEIALTGGPTRYTTTVHPGPPLRDTNVLTVQWDNGGSVQATFQYVPPKAVARRIERPSDLLSGPLAHGRIGDYLLANREARFVVQDVGKRDLYSVGAFGGNLIDAELTSRPGTDNFLEIQPTLNIESVVNAQTLEIVNDGQDGTAAIIRTCGPDDLLDFVNPSTIIQDVGLPFPEGVDDTDYEIDACTDYVLAPGKTYVEMTTTVFNNEDEEIGLFVGDFINGSGELEQWTSSASGLGELLTANLGVLSYFGFGEATGVDYSLVPLAIPSSPEPRSSFFTAAGVSYVMQSNSIIRSILGGPATFRIPAHGSNAYTRYFGVGDGSGGNAVTLENEVKGLSHGTLRGCVTVAGIGLPGSRVSALRRGVAAPYVTNDQGCFEGTLPPGTYQVGAARRGHLYEGGGSSPLLHEVTIDAGAVTEVNIDLPASGRLHVRVVEVNPHTDGPPSPVPARISVIGFDPSPEPLLVFDGLTGRQSTGIYNDLSADGVPFGFVWLAYAGADGVTEFDLEPGDYQVFVSRGTEYSLFDQPITIRAGQTTNVEATLVRVLDTRGFISSDFHVHSLHSADSRVSLTDRAYQFAGEGIDNVIMTDHHAHTDLKPAIERLGLQRFLHSTIGEEITTWDYGHFNAYPMLIDSDRPSGGSTDWAGAAPPGRDFPKYGAYGLPPADVHDLATQGPTSTPDTTIQINHINSFFAPLRIDTSLVPPRSLLSEANRLRFRLDPNGGELFHHFRALELWNGASRASQAEFLNERIGIWMNHLNQGLLTTFIADTDTHQFRNLNTAGARTWTAASSDDPQSIDSGEMARSVDAGKAVGGQGIFLQSRLVAADGSGRVADFTLDGHTMVRSDNGGVDLEIHVQAPLWAEYDRIEIYANAATVPVLMADGVPVLFTATPTRVLHAGEDFIVDLVDVIPGQPWARRRESRLTVPLRDLVGDVWFVVIARGSDGISRPMFPVFDKDLRGDTNTTLADLLDGNLNERGVLAMGATNALYADVDGVDGFHAPWVTP
jgi:hypothetical protein